MSANRADLHYHHHHQQNRCHHHHHHHDDQNDNNNSGNNAHLGRSSKFWKQMQDQRQYQQHADSAVFVTIITIVPNLVTINNTCDFSQIYIFVISHCGEYTYSCPDALHNHSHTHARAHARACTHDTYIFTQTHTYTQTEIHTYTCPQTHTLNTHYP